MAYSEYVPLGVARTLRVFLSAVLVVGCGAASPSSPPPSATRSPIAATPRPTTAPSPTPAPCVPFESDLEVEPGAWRASGLRPEVDGLERLQVKEGEWHQPPPYDVLATSRSEPLVMAYLVDREEPVCLGAVTVDAAPFSPLALAPEPSALIRLAATAPDSAPVGAFPFEAPASAGEWVVRVTVLFDAPEPTGRVVYFRLRVDLPPPEIAGTATAPGGCTKPGADPPRAFLSVDGAPRIAAQRGSLTWRFVSADGGPVPGPQIDGGSGAGLVVTIEDHVCAGWWRISIGPLPDAGRAPELITDLVPAYISVREPALQASRFTLAPVPSGDWIVDAFFYFANGRGQLIGDTTNFWHVAVD